MRYFRNVALTAFILAITATVVVVCINSCSPAVGSATDSKKPVAQQIKDDTEAIKTTISNLSKNSEDMTVLLKKINERLDAIEKKLK